LQLDREFKKLKVFWKSEEVLKDYTTVKIGGACKYMVFPDKLETFWELIELLENRKVPYFVLGGGSKLLVGDDGFRGVVINMRLLSGIKKLAEDDERIVVKVLAGTVVGKVISWGLKQGASGLEFMAGIPASIGGMVKTNAGAFGETTEAVLKEVVLLKRGKFLKLSRTFEVWKRLWKYREFKETGVILCATFSLKKLAPSKIVEKIRNFVSHRIRTQPIKSKTFGCVFKNPEGSSAGELIEKAGLKGYLVGRAMVSKKHANFIENLGGATARDVIEVIKRVREEVFKKFGVKLEPEVRFLGCSLEG